MVARIKKDKTLGNAVSLPETLSMFRMQGRLAIHRPGRHHDLRNGKFVGDHAGMDRPRATKRQEHTFARVVTL